MIRSFLIPATLVFAVSLLGTTLAHAQLGVAFGANFDRLSDIELTDGSAAFENRTGWHAEVWFEVPLGALALRPGLRYMDAGALYRDFSHDYRDLEDDFSVNLLEVPLNARIHLGDGELRPYLIGGPVLRFPFADDDGLNDDLRTVSLAGGLGIGLDVSLGGLTLLPELSYTFGVSNFVSDEFRIGNRTFITNDVQHLNAVMLRLGLAL